MKLIKKIGLNTKLFQGLTYYTNILLITLILFVSMATNTEAADETFQTVEKPDEQLNSELTKPLNESFFSDKALYFELGIGYGMLGEEEDRDVVNDSLWIDSRVGYQLNKFFGIHLEGSYFISTVKNISPTVNSDYWKIGPGVKFQYVFNKRVNIFIDFMVGYGRMSLFTRSGGTTLSVSETGFATASDIGSLIKVFPWGGVAPYVALNTINGKIDGVETSSFWMVTGVMLQFNLDFKKGK
jgi:hypothetical protein